MMSARRLSHSAQFTINNVVRFIEHEISVA